MKRISLILLVGVSMAALLAGGCANKEAVKQEETVVPVTTTAKPEQSVQVEEVKPVEQAQTMEMQPSQSDVVTATDSAPLDPAAAAAQASAGAMLETVYFDFDKSDLRQDARDVISKNAEALLKPLAGVKVRIAGHCDERGSAEYNLALGEHRANSVQKYLTTLGVKAADLSVISYGEEKPAVVGNDESAWGKNRRAEFVVVK